jgi:hypothetical protein
MFSMIDSQFEDEDENEEKDEGEDRSTLPGISTIGLDRRVLCGGASGRRPVP